MNISNYDKAEVLAALYNNSRPLGLGVLHFDPTQMSKEEAQSILNKSDDKYFDYLKGRVMKVSLEGNYIRTDLYNRDNGWGRAEDVIKSLKPISNERH